jgi:hypothetical protein
MSCGHFDRADMGVGEPEGAQQHRIETPAAPRQQQPSRQAAPTARGKPTAMAKPTAQGQRAKGIKDQEESLGGEDSTVEDRRRQSPTLRGRGSGLLLGS